MTVQIVEEKKTPSLLNPLQRQAYCLEIFKESRYKLKKWVWIAFFALWTWTKVIVACSLLQLSLYCPTRNYDYLHCTCADTRWNQLCSWGGFLLFALLGVFPAVMTQEFGQFMDSEIRTFAGLVSDCNYPRFMSRTL